MPLDGDGFGFDEGGIEGGDTPSSPRGRKTSISRALLAAVASTRDDGGDVGATFSFGGDEGSLNYDLLFVEIFYKLALIKIE